MEEKIKLIEKKIKDDLNNLDEEKIESFFDEFKKDKDFSFIEYYNKTVLDKERISFGEFVSWRNFAIRGMPRTVYNYFDENYGKIIEEIKRERNIEKFFSKYCKKGNKITNSKRNEVAFCSKLFHTILPDEYPPVDSRVRERFRECRLPSGMVGVLIIKKAYKNSIKDKDNKDKLDIIKEVLSKKKFSEFRAGELSDMRILDMLYWFGIEKMHIKKVPIGGLSLLAR